MLVHVAGRLAVFTGDERRLLPLLFFCGLFAICGRRATGIIRHTA
ncbi:hypothetical protein [Streptomyces sp. cmx-4-7]